MHPYFPSSTDVEQAAECALCTNYLCWFGNRAYACFTYASRTLHVEEQSFDDHFGYSLTPSVTSEWTSGIPSW